MHRGGYSSWVVCLSVCPSHVGVSVRLENAVTYPMVNEGHFICGYFCETTLLQRSSTSGIVQLSFVGHFCSIEKRACTIMHITVGYHICDVHNTPRICTLVRYITLITLSYTEQHFSYLLHKNSLTDKPFFTPDSSMCSECL